jgi:hypothetical protein
MWRDYKSRDGTHGNKIYVCPFARRFGCNVRFRVENLDGEIRLLSSGKHDANSHAVEHVQRGLSHDQRAAIESVARAHPTASSTQVRRNLALQEKSVYVSPSKHRSVARIAKQVRESVFAIASADPIDETAGALTRLSGTMFLKTLIDEHNQPGGKHLQLHDPICLGYQFEKNVIFGCYSSLMLLLKIAQWYRRPLGEVQESSGWDKWQYQWSSTQICSACDTEISDRCPQGSGLVLAQGYTRKNADL